MPRSPTHLISRSTSQGSPEAANTSSGSAATSPASDAEHMLTPPYLNTNISSTSSNSSNSSNNSINSSNSDNSSIGGPGRRQNGWESLPSSPQNTTTGSTSPTFLPSINDTQCAAASAIAIAISDGRRGRAFSSSSASPAPSRASSASPSPAPIQTTRLGASGDNGSSSSNSSSNKRNLIPLNLVHPIAQKKMEDEYEGEDGEGTDTFDTGSAGLHHHQNTITTNNDVIAQQQSQYEGQGGGEGVGMLQGGNGLPFGSIDMSGAAFASSAFPNAAASGISESVASTAEATEIGRKVGGGGEGNGSGGEGGSRRRRGRRGNGHKEGGKGHRHHAKTRSWGGSGRLIVESGGKDGEREKKEQEEQLEVGNGALPWLLPSSPREGGRLAVVELPAQGDGGGYELVGTLFKRRGGIGRLLGWKPRLFTLYKGKLCYYEAEILEEVDNRSKPRGVFDLTVRGVSFELHETNISKQDKPPSEYFFSVYGAEDDQKWRMCAASKEDLIDWCKALYPYLGEPIVPGDVQGVQGVVDTDSSGWSRHGGGGHRCKLSLDEAIKAITDATSGIAPAVESSSSSSSSTRHVSKHGHNRRSLSGFLSRRDGKEGKREGGGGKGGRQGVLVPPRTALHPPMAAVAAVEAKADPTPSSPVMMHSLNKTETVAILVTCNFLLLLLRVAPSFYLFLVLTLGINFILAEALSKSLYTGALTGPVSSLLQWMCVSPLIFLVALIGGREERAMARSRGGAASVAGADGGGMGGRWMKEKEGGTAVLERRNTMTTAPPPSRMPPVGSTIPRCPAEVAGEGEGYEMPPHTWTTGLASNIRVRARGYKQSGKKEPSAASLYKLVNFDFVRSPSRVSHVASLVQDLPEVKGLEGLPAHIPKTLVVTWQAPSEKPSLLAQEDGPGWSCILYFVIKPDTALAYIKGEEEGGKEGGVAMTAGMKLFGEFMRNAVPVDGGATPSPLALEWRERFKAICLCKNMDELGLPSFIAQCNGKPILVKHTAKYYRGKDYVEIDINMHKFAYLARKGIQILQDKLKLVAFECAFTVEGRTDEELPEVVMGLGKFCKIDVKKSVALEY